MIDLDKFDKDSFENVDYIVSCDLLKNYSGMRMLALGGAITLVVSLTSISRSEQIIENIIQNLLLIIGVHISIRVIGSIHSNVYARCLHLEWLESKLEVVGFFTYWNKYVLQKSKNASSNAFMISCIGFNYISLIITLIYSYKFTFLRCNTISKSSNDIPFWNLEMLFLSIVLVGAIVSFFVNHRYLENKRTNILIPNLRESLRKERELVSPKKFEL